MREFGDLLDYIMRNTIEGIGLPYELTLVGILMLLLLIMLGTLDSSLDDE